MDSPPLGTNAHQGFSARTLNLVWLVLIGLTLAGMAMGRSVEPGFWITVAIAAITAVKGRLVIDCFMELGDANPAIRRLVRLWGLLVPALMIVLYLWAPLIESVTSL